MAKLIGADVIQVIRIEQGLLPLGEHAEEMWFASCGFELIYDDELLESWQLAGTSRQR